MREYFGVVGQAVHNNSNNGDGEGVKIIEQYLVNKLAMSNLTINLPQTLTPHLV